MDARRDPRRPAAQNRYARATVSALAGAGFQLLPTFVQPHYSVVLPSYDEATAQRLLDVLGDIERNPYYVGNRP